MLSINPKIKFSVSSMQMIASLLTAMKIKCFCIHGSRLFAVIECININNQYPLVIADLRHILEPYTQLGIDTKQFKKILNAAKLQKIESVTFENMFQTDEVNSKGDQLLYIIQKLGLISDLRIYSSSTKKYSIIAPELAGATSIFKSNIGKEKVNSINTINKESQFKDCWELLIKKDKLETIHKIDRETSLAVKFKIGNEMIEKEQVNFVLAIPYFASTNCRQEIKISGVKTASNKYWIISTFLHKELTVHIFEQAELIKFTPYTRSANYLETYIRANNRK